MFIRTLIRHQHSKTRTIRKAVCTLGPVYASANRVDSHRQTKDMVFTRVNRQAIVTCIHTRYCRPIYLSLNATAQHNLVCIFHNKQTTTNELIILIYMISQLCALQASHYTKKQKNIVNSSFSASFLTFFPNVWSAIQQPVSSSTELMICADTSKLLDISK